MSTLQFAIIIFAFIILLLLNIFFVYIPVNEIADSLTDIDNKVKEINVIVKPVITKLTPLIEDLF